MTVELEEAITDLQQRVSFQDEAITKLSDHIALQDKELIETKRIVAFLREKLIEVIEQVESGGQMRGSERPPHY